ncbi:GPI transamidase subunit PIG-U - like 1 [Theobroma cacao]|nr:GPI transamidase subunit PIG-U - like 1 [Theobroma cacao]
MQKMGKQKNKTASFSFWNWVIASIIFRLILIYFPKNLNLASRPEVSTPLTSFRRLAEGYWLKQLSMSPYAGSMYHGSPLLLSLLGPLTVKRIEGQPNHLLYSLVSVIADVVSAILIRATGKNLRLAYLRSLESLDIVKQTKASDEFFKILSPGDAAALIYLWNPFTIVACVGLSTSPIENMAVILCLYGACSRLVPLAAFGWVIATHLSLYPAILIIPVIYLLGCGPDAPPRKLFLQKNDKEEVLNKSKLPLGFSWRPITHFAFWALLWSAYVLVLCGISLKQFGGLWEMFKSTYGFILTVEDLSPNIGVLWYFFAEAFDFFRNFFLIVFHVNILFMIMPLAIRLNHRPCFLAFVYIAIFSMLKSYPSGTGNANFYFATAMVYACLQGLSYENMTRTVQEYVESLMVKYPFWNRTLGADHFFVTCHDIGLKATVGVAHLVKNSIRVACTSGDDDGYIPHKDFPLPQIVQPFSLPAARFDPENRYTLGFWAGSLKSELRRELVSAWQNDTELDIQSNYMINVPHLEKFNTAKFCICPGWSHVHGSRIALSIHHGCVPVIMSDHHDLPFNDILDWSKFSIIIKEDEVQQIKHILERISYDRFKSLHYNTVQVQRHLQWNSPPIKYDAFHMVMYQLWRRRHVTKY